MKILVFSDVHWSRTSSIVRQQGKKYTLRLEHLIDSMNWLNKVAEEQNCDMLICAGDMMDRSFCNDEELTALNEIKWANKPCYFLCGNHESSVNDLRFSSVSPLLTDKDNSSEVIKNPRILCSQTHILSTDKTDIVLLPYIEESDRKDLKSYLKERVAKQRLIISHNDIKGIQYGAIISKAGFSLEEIAENCDLYLNGHLHNTTILTPKIINVGSLSAHNFTNDSMRYSYGIWIVDTDTLETRFIENPYGFNFYKIEIKSENDLKMLASSELKNNAVISFKCHKDLIDGLKEIIANKTNIIDYKLVLTTDDFEAVDTAQLDNLTVDHFAAFIEICKANIAQSNVLEEELSEICK